MVTASFRFHDELNAFLPPARRKEAFAVPCARAATVKHMIEALGVPHTEVGLVLVNGLPVDCSQLLMEGDRVTVFPHSATTDGLDSTRSHAVSRPRFVADSHLGALAHLLRMLGFDTLYDNHFEDAALVEIAAREGRYVLTRDRELLKRRDVMRGCYVHALKPEPQLREIVVRLGLAQRAQPLTLCLHCNLPLQPVDKASVLHRLPPRVQALYTRFSTCSGCRRIYWEGSHWRNMQRVLEQLLPGES